LDCARTIAYQHFASDSGDPFPDGEICKVAESVWRYELEGRNWAGREPRVSTTKSEYNLIVGEKHGSDALALLIKLRLSHWNRPEFALSLKAMAGAGVIPGWSVSRYRNARVVLVRCGLIVESNRGGRGAGDACRFTFGATAIPKGLKSVPNITEHPLPFLPSSSPSPFAGKERKSVTRTRERELANILERKQPEFGLQSQSKDRR
jgi:hypothetical protein